MCLYSIQSAEFVGQTAELGQALADVATIGILHERAFHRQEVITEQLERALSSACGPENAGRCWRSSRPMWSRCGSCAPSAAARTCKPPDRVLTGHS
jgi:hypothetical protein